MRVTARMAADQPTAPIETAIDGDRIYWTEAQPALGGRTTVRSWHDGRIETPITETHDVRSRVHGYGGGAIAAANGFLYFTDRIDGRLHRQDPQGRRIALTRDDREVPRHYADIAPDRARSRIICVEEAHHSDGQVHNHLVAVSDDGSGQTTLLSDAFDFVAAPRIDPGGARIAWIGWFLPHMRWDRTELWVADLTDQGIANARCVARGASIADPQWTPDGRLLHLSDAPGYWMLHSWDGTASRLIARTEDLSAPQLRLNFPRYAVLDDDTVIAAETRSARTRLIAIDLASGTVTPIPLPFTDIQSVRRIDNGRICTVGFAEDQFPAIVEIEPATARLAILHRAERPAIRVTLPEDVAIPTADGATIHGFLYRAETAETPPPLIVMAHGGPINQASAALSLTIQFWLESGFSCLDINYRGSSGFGRAFRDALRGEWGELDWRDAVSAADHAVAMGWADPTRLIVRGASAGGFTTLCALARSNRFAAGGSHFGVSDPAALRHDTHKFESGYLETLIGPWPDSDALYRARAPIEHADAIAAPLILFQGLEDRIVPPDQTQRMAASLAERGIACEAHYYPGQGHGFDDLDVKAAALEAERAFYCRVLSIG
jgi:dipeptidyl aminopeptidase/acylaminoacyl peptidase